MMLTDLDNIVYNMFASGEITLAKYLKYENGDKNMNYEEKYKQALERAMKLYEQGTITECLGWVFPEIKESKDERIRKTLIAFFRDWERTKSHCWNVNVTDVIAWLEKQGHMLSPDKVVEWIERNEPKFWESPCNPDVIIEQFKEDFGLC